MATRARRPAWLTRAATRDDTAATRYAVDVCTGATLAGPWVRLACERHLRDLVSAHKRGLRYDPDDARHILDFFGYLRLAEGQFAGQPFRVQPWQAFILQSLFGWKSADGLRRFRTAYIEVGKGNGKTPMAAGIGLYGLAADGEAAAEIYSAATTREQARLAFLDATRMVGASPDLSDAIRVSAHNLAQIGGASFFRPVSSEHRGLDGKRVHFSLIDELHEHPTDLVVEKMRAGMKARSQPLQFEITNAGHDRATICWQHHDYSTRLLEQTVDNDTWFCYVCAIDDDDDPLVDEACWVKANPNLGVSIQPVYLRDQVREALGMPPKESIVRRLNFCIWTKTITRALDLAAWDACPAIDDAALVGVPVYAGLDLGQSSDLSALAILWELPGGHYALRCRIWLPEATVEAESSRPYDAWLASGLLELTPGTVTDYDVVEDAVREGCHEYSVRELAYDRRFAQQLAHHLDADGIAVVDQPQGFQLNEACVRLGELVAEGKLHHDHDPLLTWCASNLVLRTGRYGEVRPDKDAAPDKIDPVVAAVMALQRAIAQADVGSVYEDRGVLTV